MTENTIVPLQATEAVVYTPPGTGGGGTGDSYDSPSAHSGHQQNIIVMVHRLLRGRYLITLVLTLIGAVGGAAGGYLSQVPKFRSEGLIRIQSTLPKILYNSDATTPMVNFSSYVSTQASLIQQDRVLNKAMASDAWRALKRPVGPVADLDFRRSLKVTTGRDGPELINVSFTDEQANAAFVAVQEVINAYEELYGGAKEKRETDAKLAALEGKRAEIERRRSDAERKIQLALNDFETDDLTRLHDFYLTQMLASEGQANRASVQLAQVGIDVKSLPTDPKDATAGKDDPSKPPANTPPPAPLTAEQIAAIKPEMAQLLSLQVKLKENLGRYKANGMGDQHPTVVADKQELQAVTATINRIVDDFAKNPPTDAPATRTGSGAPNIGNLIAEYSLYRRQADAARAQTERISKRQREIDGSRSQIKMADEELAIVKRRIDEVTTEAKGVDTLGGRIEKILPEAAPGTPTVDARKKFGAMGLFLGGGVPLAAMLLLGLIDRRFRYADQASDSGAYAPMLGILPLLPKDGEEADPEQSAAAVHCVHHIRSLLQINDASRKVYVITSPTAGDGKTSLALSLAMSFTASGSHTLVIDFDLIGCGLTSRLNAIRPQGTGHALVSGAPSAAIMQTAVEGMDLLPAGRDDAKLLSRISRRSLETFLDECRAKYDSIVIDTGPALGSLEANMAASIADGVVLVVGRGQHGSRVQEALKHLTRVGANVVGMVFNRAHATDFARSSMSKSFRSVRTGEPREVKTTAPTLRGITTTDPLAQRVESDIAQ